MTPEELERIVGLLPCYRAAQLDSDQADAVRQALHEDASLRQLLATIQDADRRTIASLRQAAPAELRGVVTEKAPTLLSAAWSRAAVLITAASLALLSFSTVETSADLGQLEPLEDLLIAARIGDLDLISSNQTGSLQQALLQAEVPPAWTTIEDLGSLGLLLDGALLADEGVAVVWRDAQGGTFLLVKGAPMDIYRTPDRVLRPDTGSGPVLQGHQLQGFSAIYWEQGGRGCSLVAGVPLDEVAGLAFQVVWRPVG